ncbi:MAG: hypothetical protein ACI8S6_005643 [Myxococcota bacterium]|jgi:hypothetical protein
MCMLATTTRTTGMAASMSSSEGVKLAVGWGMGW